jgi:hypothetical protein
MPPGLRAGPSWLDRRQASAKARTHWLAAITVDRKDKDPVGAAHSYNVRISPKFG